MYTSLVGLLIVLIVFGTIWGIVGSALSYKRQKLLVQSQNALQLESGLAQLRRADATFIGARSAGQTWAMFQISDGSSVELPVADSEARSFVPGITGILEWQGGR